MIKFYRHRMFLPILVLLFTWAGCGFQMYAGHRNRIAQQELKDAMQQITNAMQRLTDAKRQTENARRQVELETERLQKLQNLLRALPPQPNCTSKL